MTTPAVEQVKRLSTIDDKITLDELLVRYKSERDPAESPNRTWASVLAWAGDRLDDDLKDFLVGKGSFILRREGLAPELEFSPRLAASIQDGRGYVMTRRAFGAYLAREPGSRVPGPEDAVMIDQDDDREVFIYFDQFTDGADWMIVPASDVRALMCAALVEDMRGREGTEWLDRVRADLSAGRVSARALTEDDYVKISKTMAGFDAGEAIGCWGWLLSVPSSIVAGIIVALIEWNVLLFLPVALGGAILGLLAMIGLYSAYVWVDVRWLRLGRSDDAGVLILLFTGPAVALLVAVLVLSLA